MMKYHINHKTGRPGICRATSNCPFGGEANHFGSKEEAQQEIEKRLKGLETPRAIRKPRPLISKEEYTKLKDEEKEIQQRVEEAKNEAAGVARGMKMIKLYGEDSEQDKLNYDSLREEFEEKEAVVNEAKEEQMAFWKRNDDALERYEEFRKEKDITRKAREQAKRMDQKAARARQQGPSSSQGTNSRCAPATPVTSSGCGGSTSTPPPPPPPRTNPRCSDPLPQSRC